MESFCRLDDFGISIYHLSFNTEDFVVFFSIKLLALFLSVGWWLTKPRRAYLHRLFLGGG